ncbi:MAG: hypothetical protein ED557_04585 [Balneola sp.]|nr:MAG: hypothetical protein ED557_04585 [Balneola sp.]
MINDSKLIDKFSFLVVTVYLTLTVFSSPIKFYLEVKNISWLYYVKDLALLLILLIYIVKVFITNKILYKGLVLISVLIISVLVSIFYLNNYIQPLFGIRVFLPLFCGIIIAPHFFLNLEKYIKFCTFLLVIIITGVIVNNFVVYPWEFLDLINLGGIEIDISREWTTGGVRRLAGFSGDSATASVFILVLYLLVLTYSDNFKFKVGLFILSLYGIILTTNKSAILVIVIITFIHLFYKVFKSEYIKSIAIASFLLMIMLPLMGSSLISKSLFNTENGVRLYSLQDRIYNHWPETLELIKNDGSVIFGRGIGGIGTSQAYFENDKRLAGDNLFLFVYANFGAIGFVLLIWLMYRTIMLKISTVHNYYAFLFVSMLFTAGITTSLFEISIVNLFLGIIVGNRYK